MSQAVTGCITKMHDRVQFCFGAAHRPRAKARMRAFPAQIRHRADAIAAAMLHPRCISPWRCLIRAACEICYRGIAKRHFTATAIHVSR